jgi:catalase
MAPRANSGRVSKALSQQYYIPKEPTIASRRIVIIGADGFCVTDLLAIRTVLASAGTTNFVIGPRRGKISSASGPDEPITADHHFEGQRSTMFDAVLVSSGAEAAKALSSNSRAVHLGARNFWSL